jgi:hypothetical protein
MQCNAVEMGSGGMGEEKIEEMPVDINSFVSIHRVLEFAASSAPRHLPQ